jgi:glycosyltransferase involved in cell wall biosynthesis
MSTAPSSAGARASAPGPCRILVLNERDPRHPRAGGAETHLYEITSRLVKRGHAVTHFAVGFAGAAARETIDGVEVRRLGALARYYPAAALTCARATRQGAFDVVLECLNKLPYFSPLYSRAPVLALCHHLFGETAFSQVAWPIAATVVCAERAIPLVYRRRRFLTISESSRADLVRRGIAPERVDVSLPGIRRPRVAFRSLRERRPLVSYVGRLEPYKRVDVLLRAVAPLAKTFPELEIAVIGRGSDRAHIERTSRELGIAERTRMLGFLDDDERDRWLAESRVCVCASEKEGWGLTVIEANAVGTPVVASDAPGLRDSVRDGETGWLAPVGDVAAFRARIADLLRADERAEAMARSGEVWSRRFDWDLAATELETAIARARSEA